MWPVTSLPLCARSPTRGLGTCCPLTGNALASGVQSCLSSQHMSPPLQRGLPGHHHVTHCHGNYRHDFFTPLSPVPPPGHQFHKECGFCQFCSLLWGFTPANEIPFPASSFSTIFGWVSYRVHYLKKKTSAKQLLGRAMASQRASFCGWRGYPGPWGGGCAGGEGYVQPVPLGQ